VIGTTLGSYRLDAELGSGGMGAVYKAQVVERTTCGLAVGATVAVKVIHPHLVGTAGFFKRFLREAEIGRRVQHESVVRTYDVDATVVDGRQINYMVMEYVQGRSLRQIATDLGTVPDALLREIALQTANGLASIHAQGIVHRDLKPENILLTDDQRVRIMDLGVARLSEASIAITREGQFAGSVLFASPEQLTGGVVGPQSDLYSLGVTLLELATGDNPFRRDDAGAVIRAHLQDTPRRAHDVNADTSQFLSEVIATLAAKAPAERFASAQALGAVLVEAERSSWWGEREKLLRRTERLLPRISVRRETPLHARDSELAALRQAWSDVKGGKGRVVLLEGEAGIGKTRLVDAFVTEVAADDPHVLYGSYPPSGGLGGISDAIIGKFGASNLEEAVKPYLRVTPTLVPAFCALTRHEPPPTGAEPLRGDALHAVMCHLMRALAAEKPTLWVVDDLHFATHESRSLILSMARAAGPHRVLLLVTSRPGLPEDEVANLGRLDEFRRVTLGRLGARDVIELLRDAFKSDALAEKLGGKIAYKSDGVPYFVFETLRGLKEGRFLEQMPDGTVVQTRAISEIEVPSTVRDLIAARLKDLAEEQRAILDVGAVMGITFDPGLVAAVLEEKKVRVLRELAEIERRLGIVRGEAGGCRFDQSQIQEILYADLMPDLRAEYHSLLADAFAEREEIDEKTATGDQAFFLANHHLHGSRPKAAAPCLTAALEHLDRQHRVESLLDVVTRALDRRGVVEGEARGRLLVRRGRALGDCARVDDALSCFEAAFDEARRAGSTEVEIRARIALGSYLVTLSRFADAETVLTDAGERARATGSTALEASALSSLAGAYWQVGRMVSARETFERVLASARSLGDVMLERSTMTGLSNVHQLLGNRVQERELRERVLELYRAAGDLVGAATVTMNLGETRRADGLYGEAADLYSRAIQTGRDLGVRRHVAFGALNLAETLTALGDAATARALIDEAEAVSREIADRYGAVGVHRSRADLLVVTGDLDGAERAYREARESGAGISFVQVQAEALLGMARVLAARGRRTESAERLTGADELATQLAAPNESVLVAAYRALVGATEVATAVAAVRAFGDKPWHVARMEAQFVLWKAGAGAEFLAEAKRLLDHLAAHAPDTHKESVLKNVPLHRDIAAAAKEAGL
jgi:tetratricopeptide (TPR) repeat protein